MYGIIQIRSTATFQREFARRVAAVEKLKTTQRKPRWPNLTCSSPSFSTALSEVEL